MVVVTEFIKEKFTVLTAEKAHPDHKCTWLDPRGKCVMCGKKPEPPDETTDAS